MVHVRTAIVPLIVFPLVGPLAPVLMVAVAGAIVGLFSYGPVGLLYFLALLVAGMPGWYAFFGPGYLCAGVLTAMVEVILKRLSLLGALLATEIAFVVYFAFWNWLGGIGGTRLSGSDSRPALTVPIVLIGAVACWFVLRAMRIQSETVADLPRLWPASRWRRVLMIAALAAGTLSLAELLK